jgi:hypothetical protein
LNERKSQQHEDDRIKISFALSKSIDITSYNESNSSNIPNQYVRVKNVAKGEEAIKHYQDQTYSLLMNFLMKR